MKTTSRENQVIISPMMGMKTLMRSLRKDKRPFFLIAEAEIKRRKGKVAESTIINETTACRGLKRMTGDDLRMCDITPHLIEEYYQWNKCRGISESTCREYLRSLRALMVRMGLEGETLFANVNTNKVKTAKRAIDEDDIEKISRISFEPGSLLAMAQAIFMFSLLANGMPFIDLAFLKWDNIKNGIITYRRRKTGVMVTVPITEKLNDIIHHLGRKDSPYVFGLIRSDSPSDSYNQYIRLLRRYNRLLAIIEKKAGLNVHITSYVARHSWASLALKRGEPLAAISRGLGHTSVLTTELYLKEISIAELTKATNEVAAMIRIDGLFDKVPSIRPN